MQQTAQLQTSSARNVAAIRRVTIMNATATQPPFIRVHFRDVDAAHHGFAQLTPQLANDPRTTLDLSTPMPTLYYPVI